MLDIRHSEANAAVSMREVDSIVATSSETANQTVVAVSSINGLAAAIAKFQSDCAIASRVLAEEGVNTVETLQAFNISSSDLDSQLSSAL